MAKRANLGVAAVAIMIILIGASSVWAAELYVPIPYATIQAAVYDCDDRDVVIIAEGTYTGDGNRDIDFQGKAITIRSTDPNDPDVVASTIIDCNGSESEPHRGFRFHNNEDANSVISGLTVINGYGPWGFGGAILCQNSSPLISDCNFVNNFASVCGGVIDNQDNSNPILLNCVFRQNSTDWGGAIRNKDSSPLITNCSFVNNFASAAGGAIENEDDSNPILINCVFGSNSSDWVAGALRNHTSSPLLINCLFTGNSTSVAGGAIQNENNSSNPILINCTFTGNTANGWAAGMVNHDSIPVISNCIFWGNRDGSGTGESTQVYGGSPVINYSCIQGWTDTLGGLGNIGDDPCFVEPGYWDVNNVWVDGDYYLFPGSACVDAGDNTPVTVDVDLDGYQRIFNGVVDMGAYEFSPEEPADLVYDLSDDIVVMYLPEGVENSLLAQLETTMEKLADGNENNDKAATNSLQAFINSVQAQRGKKIPEADADSLIITTQEIIDLLSDG